MTRFSLLRSALFLCLPIISCGGAQSRLALRRVVLYQNGIGYFEREGELHGNRYRLQLRGHEVGDVLKSLIVIDHAEGRQRAVSAVVPQPEKDEKATAETWLDLLLQERGRHDVTVAYAVPTPVWKPSYRVVLPEPVTGAAADALPRAESGYEGGLLQAWAIVDNASGEPWERVELVLATGAPLSFAIDLRTPHFVARPDLTGQLVQPVALGMVQSERTQAESERTRNGTDTDRDGIADVMDKCPSEPETYNGFEDEDGCPDRGRVIVTSSKIEILDKVFFERGAAEVRAATIPLLDAVAAVLKGNPDITLLEIGGHACPGEGSESALSERRASAVRYQLTKRGVEGARLVTRGHAADRPVSNGRDEESCSRNRRVEFTILQRRDDASGAPAPQSATPNLTSRMIAQSARSLATPQDLAGSTRYRVSDPVTLPRHASTMVSLLTLQGGTEDIYLFRPDASVRGSDRHPLRAARVHVGTALEPGPVTVFSRGSFVGEGVLTRMHEGETALIPYAIDSATQVTSSTEEQSRPLRLVSLRHGSAVVEDRESRTTRYEIAAGAGAPGRIFVRHPRRSEYTVPVLPKETETSADALLVPCPIQAGKRAELAITEQRSVTRTLPLKTGSEPLGPYLDGTRLPPATLQKLRELWQLQQESLGAESSVLHLRQELDEVRGRAEELRDNLRSVEKIPTAAALRAELLKKLGDNERKSDELQKQVISRTEAQAAASARLNQLLSELSVDEQPAP